MRVLANELHTDSELLSRYCNDRSEAAFAEILERHSAMVFRTCLRLLNNVQEAEDATQATFIVLSQRPPRGATQPLAIWLYDTARDSARIALRARIRRARREREAAALDARRIPSMNQPSENPLREELDAALARLPVQHRAAVVLHYLEGRRVDESARLAGWPPRTFARYAAEGLERLREMLGMRGAVLSTGALITLLAQESAAHISSRTLIAVKSAFTAAGTKSAGATTLANGVTHGLLLSQAKFIAAAVLAIAVAVTVPLTVLRSAPAKQIPIAQPMAVAPVAPPAVPAPVAVAPLDEFTQLQQTIAPTEDELRWARIPWVENLWEARQRAAAEGKPILLWESWGHPLGTASTPGVLDRVRVFNDPEISRLVSAEFISVACDDWYMTKRKDDEAEFFRSFGHRINTTWQGIYCVSASGQLLSLIPMESSSADARAGLNRALEQWKALPQEQRAPGAVRVDLPKVIDQRWLRTPPPNGLCITVYSRTLDRDEHNRLIPARDIQRGEFRAAGVDHLWITEAEANSLFTIDPKVGDNYPMPAAIANRILCFHLNDFTRGEPATWEPDQIRESNITLTVEDASTLRIDGHALLATKAEIARAKQGFDVTLSGSIHFDAKTQRIDRFDLNAVGEHWGDGEFNRAARPGRTWLGVSFQLSRGESAVDRVPPFQMRGPEDYYGKK